MFSHIKELFTRPSGYTIARSVRLRSSASAYFNRTLTTPTNNKIWTWSGWVKRGILGTTTNRTLFRAGVTSPSNGIRFEATTDVLRLFFNDASSGDLVTTQVFRDPSAWYHIIVVVDTTQATAANRVKIYINGAQVTAFSTASYPAQNYDPQINSAILHTIGAFNASGTPAEFFDGYMTEVNFIDGQALTPSSFGETDSITGVWKPKKYSGTYGTNGFYLNFSDNSNNTAATIGKDYSGNGNNWTPNNISVTAGSTYDSMTDVPTLTSATAANYCVVNPLDKGGGVTITDGNLTLTRASSVLDWDTARCTIQVPSTGKYYWELTLVSGSNDGCLVGVGTATADLSQEVNGFWAYQSAGYIIYNGSYTTATALSVGDVVMVAFDRTSNKLWFGRNGTWGLNGGTPVTPTDPNSNFTSLPSDLFPAVGIRYTANSAINFGQRPFSYTPPTGYVALNTYNLPDSTIKNGAGYMAATTYTGTGASLAVSNAVNGVSFQPDFVWIKDRSNARNNSLLNSITGTSNILFSDLTNAEQTGTPYLTSFNSNGFTAGPTYANVNGSGETYVGWQWKAGGTSSSNTNGSITSTVSAGATQGFSVATYTGTGANATVGHGLGVAPSMAIIKRRSTGGSNWLVYHVSLTATSAVYLNTTEAKQTFSDIWNNTAPTSTVMSLGTTDNCNLNGGTYVAYFFAAVAGYSAFGSYTGNGSSDGPFVYTGFRPRFFMIKRTDTTTNWIMYDTTRMPYNSTNPGPIYANLSSAEETNITLTAFDILSNGFKLRNTSSWAESNASGGTYIYMAFAENPFKNALAR